MRVAMIATQFRTAVGAALVSILSTGSLAGQQAPELAAFLMTDRAAEVALARTAAPGAVSDSATVLVLTRTGYVEAVRGSNGFTCVVFRGFAASTSDPVFWNPRIRAPHCFNPPAVHSVLPAALQRATWLLSGLSPAELDQRTRAAYASGAFALPSDGAMAYMLSPKQHLSDDDPHWMPHVMFYYHQSLAPRTWGAGGMSAPVIDASVPADATPINTLLIPVPQWSDGSPFVRRGH